MKNKTTTMLKNKKMNSATYALRREVMSYIYEAKTIADLPRIDVRITNDDESDAGVLAVARMQGNIIWVSESAINDGDFDLRTIVFHELAHAVFGIEHDDSCPLMKPHHSKLSKDVVHRLFKKYANRDSQILAA